MSQNLCEHIDDRRARGRRLQKQSTESESLMGIKRAPHGMAREHCIELVAAINHEGMIGETLLVIVHVRTKKQEKTVFSRVHKGIPLGGLAGLIGAYFKHCR